MRQAIKYNCYICNADIAVYIIISHLRPELAADGIGMLTSTG